MEAEYQAVAHKTVYGFQETNKQSGRWTYASTALDSARFVEKSIGSGNMIYLKI